MKKTFLLVILSCLFSMLFAGNVVPVESAKTVSRNFINSKAPDRQLSLSDIKLEYVEQNENGEALYYRFSLNGGGFIIVSADESATPILAYSLVGEFQGTPESAYFLNNYKALMKEVKTTSSQQYHAAWRMLESADWNGTKNETFTTKSVAPLLSTYWDQGTFYNTNCPAQSDAVASQNQNGQFDDHVPVGCVAVAMGQVMNYYRYPESGIGGISYIPSSHDVYPRQTADFAHTNYQYDYMSDFLSWYNGATTQYLHHLGISVQMQYGSNGSSAYSYYEDQPNALDAMKNIWKYHPRAGIYQRSDYYGNISMWDSLVRNELDSMRPIYYSAQRFDGGHAFVLDGYQIGKQVNEYWTFRSDTNYVYDHLDTLSAECDTVYAIGIDTNYVAYVDTMQGGYSIPDTLVLINCDKIIIVQGVETTVHHALVSFSEYVDSSNYELNDCVYETRMVPIIDTIICINHPIEQRDTIWNADSTQIDTIIITTIDDIRCDTTYLPTMVISFVDSVLHRDTSDMDNMYHVNFGWGGGDNGYYTLLGSRHLNGYTDNEQMFLGMIPSEDVSKPDTISKRYIATTGSISDGAGNQLYSPTADYTWVISAPNANSYLFRVGRVNTEENGDIVSFYDAANPQQPIQQISGNYSVDAPMAFVIDADSVLVHFVANGNENVGYGFVFDYNARNLPRGYCFDGGYHSIDSTMIRGVISDKGNAYLDYEDDVEYRPETSCQWLFRRIDNPYLVNIHFAFDKLNLGDGDFIDFIEYSATGNAHNTLLKRIDKNHSVGEAFNLPVSRSLKVLFITDNAFEGTGFEMSYQIVTNITDNGNFGNVNIYPNPAQDVLHIDLTNESTGKLTFRIMDITGKTILLDQLDGYNGAMQHSMNIDQLASGLYMLRIENAQGNTTTRKFIVE